MLNFKPSQILAEYQVFSSLLNASSDTQHQSLNAWGNYGGELSRLLCGLPAIFKVSISLNRSRGEGFPEIVRFSENSDPLDLSWILFFRIYYKTNLNISVMFFLLFFAEYQIENKRITKEDYHKIYPRTQCLSKDFNWELSKDLKNKRQ